MARACRTCELGSQTAAEAVALARTGSIAGAAVRYGVSSSSLGRHIAAGHHAVDLQGIESESLTEITSHRERLLAEIRALKASSPTVSETLRLIDAESKLIERANKSGPDLVAMRAEVAAVKQDWDAIKRVIVATARDHPEFARTLSNQARSAGLTTFADALRPLFKE